jgi:hypothetical protein
MPMSLTEVALRAKEQLSSITGLPVSTVSSLQHGADGWHVITELIEMRRIPDSSDILATYELLLDESGQLMSYQRTRRYARGDTLE